EDDLAAPAALHHVPGDQLTHVEAAKERPLQHVIEGLRVVVEERPPPREGGVTDKEVDATQRLECPSDDALAGGALEDVALDKHGLTAQSLDVGDDGLGLRGEVA